MNFAQQIEQLGQQYDLVDVIYLDYWHTQDYTEAQRQLKDQVKQLYRAEYKNNQRLVFVLNGGELYADDSQLGLILKTLQIVLNQQDISNYFVVVLSNNPDIQHQLDLLQEISTDPVPITHIYCEELQPKDRKLKEHPAKNREIYHYNSVEPQKVSLDSLTERQKFLLAESKTFCMYPWIHLHAYPTGEAYPCCHAEMHSGVGNCRQNSLEEIFNSPQMRQLRSDMLSETPNTACGRCYEQEKSGFFSGRRSANKHHGHNINLVSNTQADGSVEPFKLIYWDIRFSNLCNLSCRSCGHIFSSSWYQDQAALAGPEWASTHRALNYAGRTQTDIWEQLVPHLDYVDQIYFAGGEPLMMEEHYRILDELERRERFDVRLTYNTNFTQTRLKNRSVFDYWRKFQHISVGASLDAEGARAEYIRNGTRWAEVLANRRAMMEICPQVDFYISATLSIMNAHHLPKFHRSWTEQGLIRAQDFNVNILQHPEHYRIDIAGPKYKQELIDLYTEHLEWLRPRDLLNRATVGFESAIRYLTAQDRSDLQQTFWAKTQQLDQLRGQNINTVLPELAKLHE
jgi:MoaA/NifB/PqqE/SkfB family radical SAM enzyme